MKPDQGSSCLGGPGSGIHANVPQAPYVKVEAASTLRAPLTPGNLLAHPLTHGPSTLPESRKFGSSSKTKDLSSCLSPHKRMLWLVGQPADLEMGQGKWDSARPIPKS